MIRKILMLSVLIFTATLGALGQKVEMDLPSTTVKQAIGELHRQGYSLVYQAGDLDTSKRIVHVFQFHYLRKWKRRK